MTVLCCVEKEQRTAGRQGERASERASRPTPSSNIVDDVGKNSIQPASVRNLLTRARARALAVHAGVPLVPILLSPTSPSAVSPIAFVCLSPPAPAVIALPSRHCEPVPHPSIPSLGARHLQSPVRVCSPPENAARAKHQKARPVRLQIFVLALLARPVLPL